MSRKTKERIDDLDKTVAYYMDKVEKLEESQRDFNEEIKGYIRKCVWESMQSWLNAEHRNIVTTLDGKIVETKYVRDQITELNEKKRALELVLERVDEELEKVKGDFDENTRS